MASTYSTNLALELIGTGDQAGTWGNTTNTNLGTLIEQAISGYVTQAITDGADTTITIPNGATGVARNMYIECTGTLSANRNLVVPTNKKLYFIYNNTSGGFAVTVKVSGGTGVSVSNGEKKVLVSNGTDIVEALTPQIPTSLTVTTLNATSATITDARIGDLIIDSATITTSGSNQNFSINPNGTGQVLIGAATDTGYASNSIALEVIADISGVIYPLMTQSQNAVRACMFSWNSASSGDNRFIEFATEGTLTGRGSVTYNRGAGQVAYNTTSDRRAKIIEGPVTNSGQVVDALNVYTGRMMWADINMPMMIADEAMQVTPYCVTGEPNAVDEKGNPIYQQMDYSALVPLLLAEIQSLRSRVAALEGP